MKFDLIKVRLAALWQSFRNWKSGDNQLVKMDGITISAFWLLLYTLFWIWILGATFKADFPYSFSDYFQAPILEFIGMVFYSLLMLLMAYWLMPAVVLIGMPMFFLVSVGLGIYGCMLLWEYIKQDNKLELLSLIGPIALGLFAYWAVPGSFTMIAEIYSRMFESIPDFLLWVNDHRIAIAILYIGPVVWMALRKYQQSNL